MKAAIVAVGLVMVSQALGEVKLPSLISDHMLLQREAKVRIWGWASPGERVKVSFNGQKAETTVGKEGTWLVKLNPMKAGGPYDLVIEGKNRVVVKDVLVGEVWVGSGQSNMAMWPGMGILDRDKEIAAANYPQIRLFQVGYGVNLKPCDNVNGNWQVCTPAAMSSFSATSYFFGRQLYKDLNVPIGLINSSVGGTAIESWISIDSILELKDTAKAQACKRTAQELKTAMVEYEKNMAGWDKLAYATDPGNKCFAKGWADLTLSTGDWKTMDLPQEWAVDEDMDIDGVVWFRRDVTIPAEWAGQDLALSLGRIDDCDTTYFNNAKVGGIGMETPEFYAVSRKYTVPGKRVKAGRNVLAVRIFDRWLDGGFLGLKEDMRLGLASGKGNQIDLSGPWLYKVEYAVKPKKLPSTPMAPYLLGESGTPGELYNAMVRPLTPYTIRGAIWYQGESNAMRAYDYQSLLSGMIRSWRKQWGEGDFPFLVVQLANFMGRPATPSDAPWAQLREAQRRTVMQVPNTGLAVTIDIGDAVDIHPKNKQEVGRRLAMAAEGTVYGKNIVYSGPIYKSMKVEGNKVYLSFDHVGGGLVAKGGKLVGFAVAGPKKYFVWAEAKIEGDQVVVWSDKVAQPAVVWYGWASNPGCNLYNKAGLPASPFTTEDK
jgi:sialate O-acetylesterase